MTWLEKLNSVNSNIERQFLKDGADETRRHFCDYTSQVQELVVV